jgi:transposase
METADVTDQFDPKAGSLAMLLTDEQWERIEELEGVGRAHPVGRKPTEDRQVLEAILWVMRHQARWQDLPLDYPSPRTCQRRLKRWQESGVWPELWRRYVDSLDTEALREWGGAFLQVLLAEARDRRGRAVAEARIGRPPFWWSMAREFWRLTWSRQPEQYRRKLEEHLEQLASELEVQDREGATADEA